MTLQATVGDITLTIDETVGTGTERQQLYQALQNLNYFPQVVDGLTGLDTVAGTTYKIQIGSDVFSDPAGITLQFENDSQSPDYLKLKGEQIIKLDISLIDKLRLITEDGPQETNVLESVINELGSIVAFGNPGYQTGETEPGNPYYRDLDSILSGGDGPPEQFSASFANKFITTVENPAGDLKKARIGEGEGTYDLDGNIDALSGDNPVFLLLEILAKASAMSKAISINPHAGDVDVDASNAPAIPVEAETLDDIDFKAFFEDFSDALAEANPDWVELVRSSMEDAENNASPIIFDLDDDGIELSALSTDNTTFFDLDGDGFAERTGFVNSDDAILVHDQDSDGRIEGTSEWFGNMDTDGFTVLSQHDINGDLVIDQADAVWDDTQLWRDLNQNGVSEAGELFALSDYDIVSIDLDATEVSQTNAGHDVTHTSTFTIDDGVNPSTTQAAHDIWFNYDDVASRYAQDYTFDLRAAYLPGQRGYGELPDLHIAMSLDNDGQDPDSLISLVTDLNDLSLANTFTDDSTTLDAVAAIMYRWAGVDGVAADSRGPNIDARKLEFLEAMTGQAFYQNGSSDNPDPGPMASIPLIEAFHIAQNNIYARLVAQGAGADLFEGDVYYDIASDSLEGVTGLNQSTVDTLETQGMGETNPEIFWANVVRVVEYTVGVSNLSTADQTYLDDAIVATDGSLSLSAIVDSLAYDAPSGMSYDGTSGSDTVNGGIGYDTLKGFEGDDTLYGGLGNDELWGHEGDDTLWGESGNDYLRGREGDDRYHWAAGHGHDIVRELGSGAGNDDDRIVLGSGFDSNDLTITRITNNGLLIEIDNGTQVGGLFIEEQFNYVQSGGHVELIEFSDSSTYDLDAQSYTLTGTEGADTLSGVEKGGLATDTLYGLGGNDTLNGDTGADILYGGDGRDTLDGGDGDDTLYGDDGDDTLYGRDGADVLDGGAGENRLEGGEGNDAYIYVGGHQVIYDTAGADEVQLDAVWNSIVGSE